MYFTKLSIKLLAHMSRMLSFVVDLKISFRISEDKIIPIFRFLGFLGFLFTQLTENCHRSHF